MELKAEARSVKKITEERDQLLQRVREWETKFASLEKSQQQEQLHTDNNSPQLVLSTTVHRTDVPIIQSSSLRDNNNNAKYLNGSNGETTITVDEYYQLQSELLKTKEMFNAMIANGVTSASSKHTIYDQNGWSQSVSTNYSMVNKNKSLTFRKSVEQEITIPLHSGSREQQLQEQLQKTMKELSRYKFRVKQLEEQNYKLTVRPLAITDHAPPTPVKFLPQPKILQDGRDSDDSMDEDEQNQVPQQDLDDKNDNWAAYLESFDERGSDTDEIGMVGEESNHADDDNDEQEEDVEKPFEDKTISIAPHEEEEDHLDYIYPSTEHLDKPNKSSAVLALSQVDEDSITDNPMMRKLKKKEGGASKTVDREVAFGHNDVYKSDNDAHNPNIDSSVQLKLNPHRSRTSDTFEEVSPMMKRETAHRPEITFGHNDVYQQDDKVASSSDATLNSRSADTFEEVSPLHQKAIKRVTSLKTMVDGSTVVDPAVLPKHDVVVHDEVNPMRKFPSSKNLQIEVSNSNDSVVMESNPLRNPRARDVAKSSIAMAAEVNTKPDPTKASDVPSTRMIHSRMDDDDSDNDSSTVSSSIGVKARMVSNVDDSDNDDSDTESDFGASQANNIWGDQNPNELIFELLNNDSVDLLEQLLSLNELVVKAIDTNGSTPLHVACSNNLFDVVRLLVSAGAPLNAMDQFGRTSLHLTRDPEIVELLAEEGANVNIQDSSGVSPLLEFCKEECLDCVKAILPYGANPMLCDSHDRHCLHVATLLGNYELLMVLTTLAEVPLQVDQADAEGFTALHFAASGDRETGEQLKIMMLLLDKGAEVKMGNARGVTSLHLICANRMLSRLSLAEPMVEMLLSCGAHPNVQDIDGCTPLIVSVAYREWNLCKQMLEVGGDLNIPCSMRSTFLQGGNGIVDVSLSASNYDAKTLEIMTKSDCTASDLLPKTPRFKLFGHIRVLQTRIPGETRDRCMNCANPFTQNSYFRMSSGKHHCRHCHRVVCQSCSPNEVPRNKMPGFVQDAYPESAMRICVVCYTVLIELRDSE